MVKSWPVHLVKAQKLLNENQTSTFIATLGDEEAVKMPTQLPKHTCIFEITVGTQMHDLLVAGALAAAMLLSFGFTIGFSLSMHG